MNSIRTFFFAIPLFVSLPGSLATETKPEPVWPGLAPGESTRHQGERLPFRPEEDPPVVRMIKITEPTFTVHLPDAASATGAGVVILPGGGFGKVVPNKEGTEPAAWLNRQGIAAFVLSYRTKQGAEPGWEKPLQDAQRTLSIVRARADEWNLKRDRIGLLGFSAGGQVVARLLGAEGKLAYSKVDEIDSVSHWPNFAMLIYPWNLYEPASQKLAPEMQVPQNAPATFLAHTDDDRASSLSSALYYLGLKQRGIPAELHVYENGGHGYGLRPVPDSQIATWTEHATHWLHRRIQTLP